MPTPPVPRTTESSGGLSPTRIAVWSGAGLILLLGGLLLLVNLKSDTATGVLIPEAKEQSDTATGVLIREAKEQMDSASNLNDLVAAKRLAEEALLVSGEKHRKEAQDLLDEIEARQYFWLIREAKEQMDSASNLNDLVAAKRLAEEALLVSGEKHRKEAQDLLDEIEARQNFSDRRVKDLVSQGERALQKGNLDEAEQLAARAAKIAMTKNHHLATGLIARIEGYKAGQQPPSPSSPPGGSDRTSTEQSWPDIVEVVKPSVVVIASKHGEDWGTGTGFFVADDVVITNQHVIAAEDSDRIASEIYIKQHKGGFVPARGNLYQHKSKDIAVLKVENISTSHSPLNLVDRTVRQGEVVAAMGHPVGLEFTFTIGYVSAVRKGENLDRQLEGTWVHHSAPISGGNSGGPLLNQQGDVVAMNSWRLVDNEESGDVQNLNFAISAEDISQMIRTSKHDRGVPFGRDYRNVTENIESLLRDLLDQ